MSTLLWDFTGTVAVTAGSTEVTGTGTSFTATARPGYAIVLPDGLPYRIDAVPSDTAITITPACRGGTQAGWPVWIKPTSGVTAEFNESAEALLATIQGYVSGVLAGRFAAGTAGTPGLAFASDTDTGLFNPAPNQIGLATGGTQRARLSNTALQVDVPLTGTAAVSDGSDTTAGRLLKTAAGPAQAFRRGNVLGAVSQTGGVPTGALVERGSNASGEFVRWADGTQICTEVMSGSAGGGQVWTFPAAFSVTPDAFIGSPAAANSRIFTIDSINATSGTFSVYDTSGARTTAGTRLLAVGRWF